MEEVTKAMVEGAQEEEGVGTVAAMMAEVNQVVVVRKAEWREVEAKAVV